MSCIDLHKFEDVNFGITQKPLYIIYHQTWSDNIYITNKGILKI